MKYESLLGLKSALTADPVVPPPVLARVAPRAGMRGPAATRLADRLERTHTRPVGLRPMALGVARGRGRSDFFLGVRIHGAGREAERLREQVAARAAGEVDIRIVPHVRRRAAPPGRWFRRQQRPLEPGLSIGQARGTAGTLGAIVEDADAYYVLSNNHVLANVNAAQPGDPVSQPGDLDRRMRADTLIGVLDRFVPISFARANIVDGAVAHLFDDLYFWEGRYRGLKGTLRAAKPLTPDDLGRPVIKAGRTTGVTRGVITLVDLDGLRVDMADERRPRHEASFSDCVEIRGSRRAFSAAGDSGSLIVDLDGHPRALLFSGTVDPRGPDLTFANRIENCLQKLGVRLVV